MTNAGPAVTATTLLAEAELPVAGLYRRHPEHNLSSIAAAITTCYEGTGPVRLGPGRGLAVIAVDGLGYARAAAALNPDSLVPLTSEFPTTTIACLLTSVTGQRTDSHGFIGVQYLYEDGIHAVNCHDGQLIAPLAPARSGPATSARPTSAPCLETVFDALAGRGVSSTVLPNELDCLHRDVRGRLLHGAGRVVPAMPPHDNPLTMLAAFTDQLTSAVAATPRGLTWAYLDLDTHHHRHGFDAELRAAAAELDRLAGRLRADGTSVLIFSDHGLTPNRPSQDTLAAWDEATSERWCRLPAGGAGRTRWLYPQPPHEDRLAARLAAQLSDAVVIGHEQLASWDLAKDGSTGQRRLGEIVLLARGGDFPAPDATTQYEHGSMTADEVLVPMAIWSAG
ncbi:MAG TPA: alkaline phosphatase family protein [Streptosporangiaceae bacterium]|nr:alkaline phosphatase family protein [Streptosporangiaceae bacterium]